MDTAHKEKRNHMMGLMEQLKRRLSPAPGPELYTEIELNTLDRYAETAFGSYETVFHELESPDIHVDLLLIEPTEDRPYYTILTQGMGAHKMKVPPQMEPYRIERAEIAVSLPADWNINSGDEADYWPLRWLKILARMPLTQNTWLGYGHTITNGAPLADNTNLSGVMLDYAIDRTTGKPARVKLPSGEEIVFYQMLPLYPEELRFKQQFDAEALLDRLHADEHYQIVNPVRPNHCIGL